MTIGKFKAGVIGVAIAAVAATPGVLQHAEKVRLGESNLALQQNIETLSSENKELTEALRRAQKTTALSQSEASELVRLRAQTGVLRGQLAELERKQAEQTAQASRQATPQTPVSDVTEDEREGAIRRQQFIAKMNYAKNWVLALHLFAQRNQERIPATLQEAAQFLPEETRDETLLATNQFELVYQGQMSVLTNPASVIVLRELKSQAAPGGGWVRTYGFADGHSEVHKEEQDDFTAWEAPRMVR